MNLRGESSHDNKRLRLDNHQHCRLPGSSLRAKEKHIIEKKAFLYVNIIRGVDIDCGFRSVTHSRYYQVESWINPGEEFRTRSVSPKVCKSNLDPVWNQGFIMPLRETSVEDATLHLNVLRESNDVLDPGTSHMIKLVGKVQFRLDQLQANKTVKMGLQLMQPGQFGWKPEGHIILEMHLRKIPI